MIQPKVIPCSWFPFKPYTAITLYKWIVVRKDYFERVKDTHAWIITLNHERIHLAQMEELGVLKFYRLYLKFFIRLKLGYAVHLYNYCFVRFGAKKWDAAYRDSPFEQEAYEFAWDLLYLPERKPFKWREYK